jgi:RNA polymerase sigma-70 factor (ECF subfamily)
MDRGAKSWGLGGKSRSRLDAGQGSGEPERVFAKKAMSARGESYPEQTEVWRYAPMLRGYFMRRIGGDIDDLVQEVLLRIERRRTKEPIDNIEGYLFQVASSVLTDTLRADRSRQRSKHTELTEFHHPVEVLSPDRVLEGKQQLALALSVLESMPERSRQAFILVRFEQMSYSAASRVMGISVSAVEKHIMKVVRRLTERLRSDDDLERNDANG